MYSNEWDQSKTILKKYQKQYFEKSGVEWTSENDAEIDKLLDFIKKGVKEETKSVLQEKATKIKKNEF